MWILGNAPPFQRMSSFRINVGYDNSNSDNNTSNSSGSSNNNKAIEPHSFFSPRTNTFKDTIDKRERFV